MVLARGQLIAPNVQFCHQKAVRNVGWATAPLLHNIESRAFAKETRPTNMARAFSCLRLFRVAV